MRGKFKSVAEYRDLMVLLQFEYLPFIKAKTGATAAPAVFKAAKKGEVDGQLVGCIIKGKGSKPDFVLVPKDSQDMEQYTARPGFIWPVCVSPKLPVRSMTFQHTHTHTHTHPHRLWCGVQHSCAWCDAKPHPKAAREHDHLLVPTTLFSRPPIVGC